MKKIWYLFKEDLYCIKNGQFIKEWTIYYLYNRNSISDYQHSSSLIESLKQELATRCESPFRSTLVKNQVPLFDSHDSGECVYYVPEAIYRAIPEIEVGKPFIDKALLLNGVFYSEGILAPDQRLVLTNKFKKYIKTKDPLYALTKEEKKEIENWYYTFATITLLYVSQVKPTVEDIKKSWPELLV